MEKTIKIGDKKVTLKATAGVIIRYKQQFGSDYAEDIAMLKSLNSDDRENLIAMHVKIGYQLVWAMAKTADRSIPSPDVWIKKLKNFDVDKVFSEATNLFLKSMEDAETSSEGGEPITAENLLAMSLICGLNTSDIDNLSVSMLINTINEYCRQQTGETDERQATQADFDAFRR